MRIDIIKMQGCYLCQAFENKLYANLEAVIDPELGVDIINLGLVYDVTADENNNAVITMTMTSIGCPMAGQIVSDVKSIINERT